MPEVQRSDRRPFFAQPVRRAAGMPRRFGVGALIALTALFATVFAVATSLGAPPVVVGGIGLFFIGVGLGQMVLFGGKDPRAASMVAGAVILPPIYIAGAIVASAISGERFSPDLVEGVFSVILCGAVLGAFAGYMAGALIAGLFLKDLSKDDSRDYRNLAKQRLEQADSRRSPFDDWETKNRAP